MHGREEALEAAADSLERDFELLGVTAIEDKLQEGVPKAIRTLLAAGIKASCPSLLFVYSDPPILAVFCSLVEGWLPCGMRGWVGRINTEIVYCPCDCGKVHECLNATMKGPDLCTEHVMLDPVPLPGALFDATPGICL